MALLEPACSHRNCKHFQGVSPDEDESKQVPICAAFPKGIPTDIAYGTNKHDKPFPGDNGIRFEKESR